MKTYVRIIVLTLLAACLLFQTGPGLAQTPPPPSGETFQGDRLVVGEAFRLDSGDSFNGDLTVIGGQAVIAEGAQVNGDIALMGGVLDLAGEVNGSISAMGATVDLENTAFVSGSINSIGAHISGASSATVEGGINEGDAGDFRFGNIPFPFRFGDRDYQFDNNYSYVPQPFDLLGRIIRDFFITLALAALALVAIAVLPMQARNVTETMASQPVMSIGVGLLTLILLPFVVVLLALLMITIILIPVTLLAYLVIGIIILLAWLSSGYYAGRMVERSLRQDWAEPVVAAIGTAAIGLLAFLVDWIPCIGWLVYPIIISFGLGALILSRFGTQVSRPRPPAAAIVPSGPVPPIQPVTPAPPVSPVVRPTPDDIASTEAVITPPPDEPKI